jgi:hypothetical protein
MKNQNKQERQGLQLLVATLLIIALTTPTAWAPPVPRGVHSSGRSGGGVAVGRGGSASVHASSHGGSVGVHASAGVGAVGVGVHHDDHHFRHFMGDVAVVAGTTLAIGAVVHALPANNQPVVVNNVTYIVADGTYYQQSGTGYVVVPPPSGVTVTALPPGAVIVTVNGQTYFQAGDIYYQPAIQNGVTVYKRVTL